MTPFAVVLYVHIMATLALATALGVEVLMLRQLRRAPNLVAANAWINAAPGLRPMATISLAGLMLSGIYLTVRMSAWTFTWARLAVVLLILFGALTGVGFNRIRTIRVVCAAANATHSEIMRRLQDPVLKGSLGFRTGLLFGVVLLMTARPGTRESLGVLAVSLALGLVFWRTSRG
jgi:hypothetical protein